MIELIIFFIFLNFIFFTLSQSLFIKLRIVDVPDKKLKNISLK